ncbi:MAG: dipeptide epimerase [Sphingobacteriales bacterium]
MNVKYYLHRLPFTYPFTISKGTKTHQPTFIVELERNGIKGYGEAPAITYYNITIEKMAEDLEAKKTSLEKFALTDPERYWHFLHHLFPSNPFLVCALDMAGWDLWSKLTGKSLHTLWKINDHGIPITDYTIGIDSPDVMIRKMKEKEWPIYKIKVGFDGDIELLRSIRKETSVSLRVDANAGWSLEEALDKLPALEELDIELIEQPLAKDNWEGMKKLMEVSKIPLFADESCVFEQDVAKCKDHFHGINIKLTKCSGLTPAKRMIKEARALGLNIMLGCMNESSIGTAALIKLSPLADYLDADGPLLLAEDLADGIIYDQGNISMNNQLPGLGINILHL